MLDRISDAAKEIALFLKVEEYDTNYDICDVDAELITFKSNLRLDATEAKNTLQRIIGYEKVSEPEKAKKGSGATLSYS